jgi:hypothetical protein
MTFRPDRIYGRATKKLPAVLNMELLNEQREHPCSDLRFHRSWCLCLTSYTVSTSHKLRPFCLLRARRGWKKALDFRFLMEAFEELALGRLHIDLLQFLQIRALGILALKF